MSNTAPLPSSLPDFQRLREKCIERLYLCPRDPWSADDLKALEGIIATHCRKRPRSEEGWTLDPAVVAIARDVEEAPMPLPKWACLVMWLAPEGIVTHDTELVLAITRYALGDAFE